MLNNVLQILVIIATLVILHEFLVFKKPRKFYDYKSKLHLMTNREEKFFRTLQEIFAEKCFVIPQVHLSAFLDHKIKGQNWKSAFQHINGKSVDYVLLRRSDLTILCAVELDDPTHNTKERTERDAEVERVLRQAKILLVRILKPEKMSKQEIVDYFAEYFREDTN